MLFEQMEDMYISISYEFFFLLMCPYRRHFFKRNERTQVLRLFIRMGFFNENRTQH